MSEAGSDTSNTRKLGQYELVDKIGQGGMGAVYRGVHSKLHKVAAIKVLPSNRLEDSQAVQRFQREIVAVAQLDHPNIIGAIDAGVDDGKHYLVMELVDGVDLSTLIKKLGPMNVADACEVVRQAAIGLEHAHEAAMVHRDIKPSNLMLAARRSGGEESASLSTVQSVTVKILDMGLALLEDKEQEGMTTTGQMMGTMEFMAPEQAGDSHSVDSRADIYSLGATLFKLLSGEAPFAGEKYDTPLKMIRALALETPPSIQERRQGLPVELIALVDCMLAKNPKDRPASAAEVAGKLELFTAGSNLARLLAAFEGSAVAAIGNTDETIDPSRIAETLQPGDVSLPDSNWISDEPTIDIAQDCESAAISPLETIKDVPDNRPKSPAALARRYRKQGIWQEVKQSWHAFPKWGKMATLGAAAMLAAALIALSILIIRVKTDEGAIVIKSYHPDVELTVKRNGELVDQFTIKDRPDAMTFKTGEFKIEINGRVPERVEIKNASFTLSRGETVVVEIIKHPAPPLPPQPVVTVLPKNPDQLAAEWVLSIGGSVSINRNGELRDVTAVKELPKEEFVLDYVQLRGTNVTDAELVHLKDCKHLTRISLYSTQITDTGLAHIQNCEKLVSLNLGYTQVGDAGLAHFKGSENLTALVLTDTQVSDAGLVNFKNCKDLSTLALGEMQIGDAGLVHFKDCKSITRLELSSTKVTDAALATFRDCKNLSFLQLGNTQVSDRGLANFKDCNRLAYLYLDDTKVSDDGLANFKDCEFLKDLHLANTQVSDLGMAHLRNCVRFVVVNLTNTRVSDAALGYLEDCENLEHLILTDTQVGNAGLLHLKDCKALTQLYLNGTQVTDEGLDCLKEFKQLTLLQLERTAVTEAGIATLKKLLPPTCVVKWDGALDG